MIGWLTDETQAYTFICVFISRDIKTISRGDRVKIHLMARFDPDAIRIF